MGASRETNWAMIDAQLKGLTCRVTCGVEYGSGFLVAKGIVLTARHCVLPAIVSANTIELKFSLTTGDVIVPAILLGQAEEFDVCLLSFEQTFVSSLLLLRPEPPREGSDWRSFGFPAGKLELGHRVT